MSQLKKQKLEAAGSSGAVQALRMENDAPVVGQDAPTANSKMFKLDIGTDWNVAGIDVSPAQVERGRALCNSAGVNNVTFANASATASGLPRNSFDLVYCRFLLLHLVDPAACLREMLEILKPGGLLVVEDGDLTSAGSIPHSSLQAFADLFGRLGPTRGLNYALGNHLYHLVKGAGLPEPDIEIHQPAVAKGEDRFLLKWSVEEAASACIAAGLVTADEMQTILADMDRDTRNPNILALMPRMSLVWARKP